MFVVLNNTHTLSPPTILPAHFTTEASDLGSEANRPRHVGTCKAPLGTDRGGA